MNQRLIWQLAVRYLRGKGSANAVPVLSRISMVAIAVGSAAMIIMFSVFNGLEFLIKDSYKAFYPDIKISAAKGKFFSKDLVDIEKIKQISGVHAVAPVIEDDALAGNENEFAVSATQQKIITVKGIANNYFKVNEVAKYVDQGGTDSVSDQQPYTGIVGVELSHVLGADVDNTFSNIMLYYVNPELKNPESDPANAFQTLKIHPAATFSVMGEFDDKYLLAPLSLVQELFHAEGKYSSLELRVDKNSVQSVKMELAKMLGKNFKVQTRFEQNQTLYMVMGGEKWAIYAILLFVLIIASFNMVGGLSMLVLEKQKDIAILQAMGSTSSAIRAVFLLEGVLWACVGGFVGLCLGSLVCLLQEKFEFIKLQGMIVDAYPVKLTIMDMLLVIATIIAVGFMAALYPSYRAMKTADVSLKSN